LKQKAIQEDKPLRVTSRVIERLVKSLRDTSITG
jgi:hypothetical protein